MKLQPSELSERRVVRNGTVLAVLRIIDHGHVFKVVAELFRDDAEGRRSNVRPYTFRDHEHAAAFVEDAVGAFSHLGCEIVEA